MFFRHLEEQQDISLESYADGCPRDRLDIHDVLTKLAIQELLWNKMIECPTLEIFIEKGIDDHGLTPKLKAELEQTSWTVEDDYHLLQGLRKHGLMKWREIFSDVELQLLDPTYTRTNIPQTKASAITREGFEAYPDDASDEQGTAGEDASAVDVVDDGGLDEAAAAIRAALGSPKAQPVKSFEPVEPIEPQIAKLPSPEGTTLMRY